MVYQLNASMKHLVVLGIRQRHPQASEEEIRQRLAAILLGPGLAERYGAATMPNKCVSATAEQELQYTMNEKDTTLRIIEVLEALNIPYAICGSLASSLYGIARTTLDSDILADIQPVHIQALVDTLQEDFYLSAQAIVAAIQHRSSFNLIHVESLFKVDIFLPKQRAFDRKQLANRQPQIVTEGSDRTAYFVSAEDIVLAKLERFRLGAETSECQHRRSGETSERQWQDILEVLTVQDDRLDYRYLRYQADLLHVADLLERALTVL